MKIREMPENARPRERFKSKGAAALSDAELFAIILRTGSVYENVVDMSNRLISEFGLDLFDCSLTELQSVKGIGESKAMQILSMGELGKRYNASKKIVKKISCAEDVYNLFSDRLRDEKQENFYVLMLNAKNVVIKEELISKGVLDSALIHPREVFKPAIKNSAARIILVHNHPSGDPSPSEEDLEITKVIMEVGEKVGIRVVDHVIVGSNTYWSYLEKGD